MPTDEMIASTRRALERERKSYELRIVRAQENDDQETISALKDRIKAVDASLANLGGTSYSNMKKAELLAAAEAAGLDVDSSNTKAEILEALEG